MSIKVFIIGLIIAIIAGGIVGALIAIIEDAIKNRGFFWNA